MDAIEGVTEMMVGRLTEDGEQDGGTPAFLGTTLRVISECVINADCVRPRPLAEWSEKIGPVLWWRFPIIEAPYVGTPLDGPVEVIVRMPTPMHVVAVAPNEKSAKTWQPKRLRFPGSTYFVGGWPGVHTHWTPLVMPINPAEGQLGLPLAVEVA